MSILMLWIIAIDSKQNALRQYLMNDYSWGYDITQAKPFTQHEAGELANKIRAIVLRIEIPLVQERQDNDNQ